MELKPLKGHDSFKIAFERGRKFRIGEILVAVCSMAELPPMNKVDFSNPGVLYFGVAAGKKISKKAVVRNRIKRLLRASLKLELEGKSKDFEFDLLIVSWSAQVAHPGFIDLNDVRPLIAKALHKAESLYNNRI